MSPPRHPVDATEARLEMHDDRLKSHSDRLQKLDDVIKGPEGLHVRVTVLEKYVHEALWILRIVAVALAGLLVTSGYNLFTRGSVVNPIPPIQTGK